MYLLSHRTYRFFHLKRVTHVSTKPEQTNASYNTPTTRAFAALALFLGLVGGIVYLNQDLQLQRSRWNKRHLNLYFLPSTKVLERTSLGHKTFMADLIWIRALLYAGSHFVNRGSIRWVPSYTNAVVTLDPKFRKAYAWGSVLMLYNRVGYTRESANKSIRLLERGQKQFPYDYYFPYSLGMIYLHEIKLSSRSYPELQFDEQKFCHTNKPQGNLGHMSEKDWQLRHSITKIWKLRMETRQKRSKKWMTLFKRVKKCLRNKAAMYLIEASTKENAPPHISRLAAFLLRRGGNSKVAICQHLQDVLWRSDSAQIRQKLRKRIKNVCSQRIQRLLLCQEWLFTRRWKKQTPYISRQLFSLLDLPNTLRDHKPLSYPIPSTQQLCSLRTHTTPLR